MVVSVNIPTLQKPSWGEKDDESLEMPNEMDEFSGWQLT